jgi:hypothetical protein
VEKPALEIDLDPYVNNSTWTMLLTMDYWKRNHDFEWGDDYWKYAV